MDLGDRVLGPATGTEAVAAWLEVRLQDRLEHQLERGLDDPVTCGRDPEPAQLAARLRDHPLAHRQRPKRPGLELGSQPGQQRLGVRADGARHHPVDTGRPCPPVAPHTVPTDQQEGGISDEVVEVIEPTTGIIGRPTVQLGLDLEYPCARLRKARPRRAGIHRRPPRLPASTLPTCCRPSPCTRLSRARTTTAAPPRPEAISRRRACPPQPEPGGGEGSPETVPTFTTHRSTGAAPSSSPAASPRAPRSTSPQPPQRPLISRPRSRPPPSAAAHC